MRGEGLKLPMLKSQFLMHGGTARKAAEVNAGLMPFVVVILYPFRFNIGIKWRSSVVGGNVDDT